MIESRLPEYVLIPGLRKMKVFYDSVTKRQKLVFSLHSNLETEKYERSSGIFGNACK